MVKRVHQYWEEQAHIEEEHKKKPGNFENIVLLEQAIYDLGGLKKELKEKWKLEDKLTITTSTTALCQFSTNTLPSSGFFFRSVSPGFTAPSLSSSFHFSLSSFFNPPSLLLPAGRAWGVRKWHGLPDRAVHAFCGDGARGGIPD